MPYSTPILSSCCCWSSLRKGSYASGIYTLIFYSLYSCVLLSFVHEESSILFGNQTRLHSESFLEQDTISMSTLIFSVVMLFSTWIAILSTFLLFLGIYKNIKGLLLPWIVTISFTIFLEICHCVYMFILETLSFNPMTATLFTLDFFLMVVHMYVLLCVVSQYQEFSLGRGTEMHERARIEQTIDSGTRTRTASAPSMISTTRGTETALLPTSSKMVSVPENDVLPKVVFNLTGKKRVQFPDEVTIQQSEQNEEDVPLTTIVISAEVPLPLN